ncbi:hypothetical protein HPB48_021424 [Haemaphysalis longicornis]|uniref:DUF7041 domain-containing protein n=1 Tax=Haemaphysalis longicornis TaxID=44386 RepID=A0A9J6FPN6_HAELO|nr:hypothetical protein HPB48_021424 [Haemaphysalis longicornis]
MTDPSNLRHRALVCRTLPRGRRTSQSYSAVYPLSCRKNPHVWFAQVEAVFDLHRVTSETTRFRHLLCNLPPEVADEVADVNRCTLKRYSVPAAQASILDRTMASEERAPPAPAHPTKSLEIAALPNYSTPCDSSLVRGNVDSNGALLKELFLQRLPQGLEPTKPRPELADRVNDATSPSVASLASTAELSAVSRLESRIDQLAVPLKRFGHPLIAYAALSHTRFFLAQPSKVVYLLVPSHFPAPRTSPPVNATRDH